MHIQTHHFPTVFGELVLGSYDGTLCLCDWKHRRAREAVDARVRNGLAASFVEGISPVVEAAIEQLTAYFAGERKAFALPLRLVGTPFQQQVWEALGTIPYGRTATYSELTISLAEPTAIRAVAAANGANALSIVVPCHRIIGADGSLVGYAGGLVAKRQLLELEGAVIPSAQVELFGPEG